VGFVIGTGTGTGTDTGKVSGWLGTGIGIGDKSGTSAKTEQSGIKRATPRLKKNKVSVFLMI
jgi:hypothetical protein